MSPEGLTSDRHGRSVRVGSRVRVVEIGTQLADRLPVEERADVLSMVGGVFEVQEIDGWGSAWVEKTWSEAGSGLRSHSLALAPSEMELVEGPGVQGEA